MTEFYSLYGKVGGLFGDTNPVAVQERIVAIPAR
jgi:hypothetical protein